MNEIQENLIYASSIKFLIDPFEKIDIKFDEEKTLKLFLSVVYIKEN